MVLSYMKSVLELLINDYCFLIAIAFMQKEIVHLAKCAHQ